MDATELRPLSLGELLDRTFRLYRSHFWLFVGIMAIPSAFSIPFSVLMFSMQGSSLGGGPPTPKLVAGMVLFAVVFVCLFCAVYALAIGATTWAVSESYLGQKISVRGAYGKVRGNFWRIIGVVVVAILRLVGMFVLTGFGMVLVIAASTAALGALARGHARPVLGVIAGLIMVATYVGWMFLWILWALRYSVSIPALLLERLGVLASLRRSVQLTKGRRWATFVAVFLCMIIGYVGVIVFQGPFFVMMLFSMRTGQLPEWLAYASAMSSAIGGAITGPVLLIALVLCYYDTRVRKEAFDLQFMMTSLDTPAPAPEAGSPA